jgi:aminoglycoside 2''-phosphotransferase
VKTMDKLARTYLQRIKGFFPQEIEAFAAHSGGDDFVIIEVNQTWMFRFPRNKLSQKAMEIETNFLEEFKATSPLPVPFRRYFGEDFVGYRKIQGEQLTFEIFAKLSKPARKRIAHQLGQFLSALHTFPVEKAAGIGIAHGWNGLHHETGLYFLEHVAPMLSVTTRKKAVTLMESLLAEEFKERVIHGDFYLPDHVFYDKSKQALSGVIDFGDVTIYDTAHDWQCIVEIGNDEFFETVVNHYPAEDDSALLKRSKKRLEARPLFVAGRIFLQGLEEQYADRLARIEEKLG